MIRLMIEIKAIWRVLAAFVRDPETLPCSWRGTVAFGVFWGVGLIIVIGLLIGIWLI